MRKTCFQMLREIGYECGLLPDLSITSFSDANLRAYLLMYLNRAKEWAARNVDLDTLMISVPFQSIASYSTGTVSIGADDTTVVGSGTTFTALMVGRKIQIGSDPTSYEIVKYTSAVSIEIDKPFTSSAQSGVAYKIFQDQYVLPARVSSVIDICRPGIRTVVERKPVGMLDTKYPDPLQGAGEPRIFAQTGVKKTTETDTAEAGTSTTALVCSSLAYPKIQNYYQNAYVYNTTRSAGAKVLSYDAPTTTLTLETAIAGQVSTDAFTITMNQLLVTLRPTPLAVYQFVARCKSGPTLFVNDADWETEIDEQYEDMLIYKAVADYYINKDKPRSDSNLQFALDAISGLKEFNEELGITHIGFSGGTGAPVADPFGTTYSRNEP